MSTVFPGPATMGLVSAGWETTGNAITNTVRTLLEKPSRWSALVRGDVPVDLR
jgi:cytochrome P450